VIPSGPTLPPNVNLLASRSQFPPPHYAIFFVTRFTSQMTRHFCGKTATLKFWKSEIRDLDFAAPWGRAKCARADYRVGFENQISIHGG